MAKKLSSTDADAFEKFKKWLLDECPGSLNLLITGKTGVGKSRLVNALVGKNVAKEGRALDPCTLEVTSYQIDIEGVTVTVWDSPGLQDGTGNEDRYIQDMKDKIKDPDLMIYCVKMDDATFHDADKKAIRTLTDAFGKEVWNHAVVALTFANMVQDPDRENNHLKNFRSKLEEWKMQLKKYFTSIGLKPKTASSIPVIPVGNAVMSMSLPDRQNWLSHLWIECFQAIKISTRREMYRINRHRLKSVKQKSSQATTARCKDGIPGEIPLDEKQKDSFLKSLYDAFKKDAPRIAVKALKILIPLLIPLLFL